jgi:O-succinylbenzoate synthase
VRWDVGNGVGRAANLALASLPGFSFFPRYLSDRKDYFEDITQQSFTLNNDSTITVPEAPGLGVDIEPDNLEKYTLAKFSIP